VSIDDALIRLGDSTAEAVSGILEMFAPGSVSVGDVTVVAPDQDPLAGVAAPAVATSVSYVDGVTGGNVFVITVAGARKLAAAMMGMDPDAVEPDGELDELELSAVAEAMNQMMASAAGATSAVLGTEVEIAPPETRTFATAEEALGAYPRAPHATRVGFSVCGEPCRLVQLVPNAFIVRMAGALDEIGAEHVAEAHEEPAAMRAAAAGAPSLTGIPVRVWAELGQAEMPSAQVVGLPAGAVVELDRGADEPIDLYVNGRRFATGRLMIVDGTDWAVHIDTILTSPQPTHAPHPESEVI
jgi:flagellar motor switch protein FliN/FliY